MLGQLVEAFATILFTLFILIVTPGWVWLMKLAEWLFEQDWFRFFLELWYWKLFLILLPIVIWVEVVFGLITKLFDWIFG